MNLDVRGMPVSGELLKQRNFVVNPWIVAITVTIATFMEFLDTSVANVALPHIAGSLSASQDESTWVLTSYLVANAIVLPISGWLASVFGRKRFYMTCVALFTISSFLCGIAPSLQMLIFFRILQGMGGGGLAPSEQAILVDTFPVEKRASAFAVYSIAIVFAPAIGPTLGGWITDGYSWRWVFFINIPVGILSLLLTSVVVSDSPALVERMRNRRGKLKIDTVGIGLIALGLGCLQMVLDRGEREDWLESSFIQSFLLIAFVALVIGVVWELTHEEPAVELSLLKERNFGLANIMYFALGFVLFGTTVLVPQFTQALLGYTATDAGMVISPGGLTVAVMTPFVAMLVKKIDGKWLLLLGLIVLVLAVNYITGRLNTDIDYRTLALARIFQGVGFAFLLVPASTVAYSYLPKEKNDKASSITNLSRNLGGSFGIAFVTTMVSRRAQFHQNVLVSHLTPYDYPYRAGVRSASQTLIAHGAPPSAAINQALGVMYGMVQRQANMLAFIDAFWLVGVVALIAIPFVLLIKKSRAVQSGVQGH